MKTGFVLKAVGLCKKACRLAMRTGSMNTKALVRSAGDANFIKACKKYIHYKEFTDTSEKKVSDLFTSAI